MGRHKLFAIIGKNTLTGKDIRQAKIGRASSAEATLKQVAVFHQIGQAD